MTHSEQNSFIWKEDKLNEIERKKLYDGNYFLPNDLLSFGFCSDICHEYTLTDQQFFNLTYGEAFKSFSWDLMEILHNKQTF